MDAVGLIEVIGYVAAIEASDACLKSANVNILEIDKVGAGIVTLTICGDVGAVESALEAGEIAVSRIGTLRASHIIPRIHNEVTDALFKNKEPKVCEVSEDTEENFEITLEITDNVSKNLSEKDNVILDGTENSENNNEKLYSDINKINKEIEVVDDSLTETNEEKIENTNDNKEVLEQVKIENSDFDRDDLSKNSVKKLKAMAKKLDSSITYKDLNVLKKEELINLVKKLSRGDR
ncbi:MULTISPECIES: BMC domain-containing protein [unclassified Clostridioides]|uniref:BMC domain-containing protein n=1 Tax=unclassified Clostridioides TaxID=2635829 RepID=UPI001D10119A|nr:BMC domain-containing protein [Clostridioides sp. ZZV14-6150]MCC0724562.1 BMC domain-containing protein [Clostridioides sp. ZZV14-6104]MCC0727603.1 BMC domain-containing protein [Clostridioides sp. ZZV14-6045]MCC0730207.1 BMC domain-containing protein [Clostridioides sp. ZZV14-6048]MCC0734590.1 BMC domain-containing protein [Clostridioides sp. ZZV14-6009]MCC0741567.1 BMC domain-containing protein [Clostridioides sp. ZZV14-6044]MCC0751741.1 BMC domain-containing protein [Clostridioides sp. 